MEFPLKKFSDNIQPVFPGLFKGVVGVTIHHPSLVFTANRSWSSPATTFLSFRAPTQSYPIRSLTGPSSSSGISFAILKRWSHVSAVLRVGMLFFSRGIYSRVYAGGSSISSCEKYPLTFRPDTCRELTIELLFIIVDNFNMTGSEFGFIFSQTSWSTNVLSLWVSNKAYSRISGLLTFTQESHTGIIIDVWLLLFVLFQYKVVEAFSFLGVSAPLVLDCSSWSGVEWICLQILQVTFLL